MFSWLVNLFVRAEEDLESIFNHFTIVQTKLEVYVDKTKDVIQEKRQEIDTLHKELDTHYRNVDTAANILKNVKQFLGG